jgi:hypothetical protein
MAATRVKLAGKVRVPWARLMVTTLSSMGWRMATSRLFAQLETLVGIPLTLFGYHRSTIQAARPQ